LLVNDTKSVWNMRNNLASKEIVLESGESLQIFEKKKNEEIL